MLDLLNWIQDQHDGVLTNPELLPIDWNLRRFYLFADNIFEGSHIWRGHEGIGMRRKRSRTSLEAKLCLLTVSLLFALLLGVGHFAMKEQRRALADQKSQAFRALAQTFAAYTESVLANDPIGCSRKLSQRLAHAGADIEYVSLTDDDGRIIFSESRHFADEQQIGLGAAACRTIRNLTGFGGLTPIKIYSEIVPITLPNGGRGRLTMGFGFGRLNDVVDDLESKALLIFTSAFIIGIILTIILARTLIAPLRNIIDGTRKIADGELSFRLSVSNDDEIGELAQNFNTMIGALQETRDQLIAQANSDSLTGLHNHRSFQEHLALEISRAERFQRDLSLLMLDIDHFKDFNDAHGHPIGDTALKVLAGIIRANVREIDTVARYGGEEFAVILPETHYDDAAEVGERICAAIKRHSFYGVEREAASLTVSIGAAQFPLHSLEQEGLILAADMALYQAKLTGRDRICVFENDARTSDADSSYRLCVSVHLEDIRAIEIFSDAIDAKQKLPEGHSAELGRLAAETAALLGLEEKSQRAARAAALLRDIAQLALPDAVLTKREPLTPEDRAAILSHPAVGYSIIQKAPYLREMLLGLLHHHERFDGAGYPFGLAGENISLTGRIVAIADAYMTLCVRQPTAILAELKQEISEAAGTAFDPVVVEAFLKALEVKEESGDLAA